MNIKSLLASVVLVGAFIGAVQALDTSSTVGVRKAITPVGVSPQVTYTEATATAAAASADRFTFDVPAPRGSGNIVGCVVRTENISGTAKPLNVSRSGNTITVSDDPATLSGTIVTGDKAIALCTQNT
ncbi:hypothetical protein [Bradyrhizobium sp.]|uniref:hypothetical protein n=1 Tax=Bradyrhizobium sp. TaxID=376 RepID=UPI002733D316|nr:hypothetical protein [Bradyrhizobium sp.]MDP3078683.1 hypothetical protein [Bradyrhizobium sp.]